MLELLRLCYWYYKCSNLDTVSFGYKAKEIHNQLGKKLTDKVRSHFSLIDQSSLDPVKFSKDLLKELSHIENTAESVDMNDKDGFYKVREDFLEKISSYVSELMLFVLLLEANVHPTIFTEKIEKERLYDMRVKGIPSDVKTLIDKYPYFDEPELNLHTEIIQSLKRKKFWEKINDAIEQKAGIIFINATATSLGKAVSKYAGRQRKEIISIKIPTEKAINFTLCKSTTKIPVVVISASIDYDRNYRITSFNVSYPTTRNKGKVMADPTILTMKDVILR